MNEAGAYLASFRNLQGFAYNKNFFKQTLTGEREQTAGHPKHYGG
jgi:hypothetical protein